MAADHRTSDEREAITALALTSVAHASSSRTRRISDAMIRHLHAFINEVEPTDDEWMAGIEFLTRTGQKCIGGRQEFILLSDVMGVSMLVDAINNHGGEESTETTVFGPFYVPPPSFASGADIRGERKGVALYVTGTVLTPTGAPIPHAMIDVWHSDAEGLYDLQHGGSEVACRGRFHSSPDGGLAFWTVRPTPYPIPNDGPVGDMLRAQGRHPFRPEHVHFLVTAPGHRKLVTQLFAAGDPYLDSDVVFGVKSSLIQTMELQAAGPTPDGQVRDEPWYRLQAEFVLTEE